MRAFVSISMIVICFTLFTPFPASATSGFDGPAELPRVTVASSMADTPARGSIVAVNAGGDLQAALNNAFCGDIVELQAGATLPGKFRVPAKNSHHNPSPITPPTSPSPPLPPQCP